MSEQRHVRAAGGVLWRRAPADGEVQVALVHRPHYDDWSLPKGKLDRGEPAVLGAVREVCEETGFSGVVGRTLGESRYEVPLAGRMVPKTVRWWAMRAGAGAFAVSEEVDALRWCTLPEALATVTAGRDSPPLLAFSALPAETTTLLVLRHGHAGRSDAWTGDDDERPLDARGEAEAKAAAAVLPVYGPTQLLSAPPKRCVDTVGPLARALDLPVQVEPALSERRHLQDPGSMTKLMRHLAFEPATVVACSQGRVIPAAITALHAEDGLALLDRVPARKGSVWALSFSGGRLVDADYAADYAEELRAF